MNHPMNHDQACYFCRICKKERIFNQMAYYVAGKPVQKYVCSDCGRLYGARHRKKTSGTDNVNIAAGNIDAPATGATLDFRVEKRQGEVITGPQAKKARVEHVQITTQPPSNDRHTMKSLETKVQTLVDRVQINRNTTNEIDTSLAIAIADINMLKIREKTHINNITLLSERVNVLENMMAAFTALLNTTHTVEPVPEPTATTDTVETAPEPTATTDTDELAMCWPVEFGYEPNELFNDCFNITILEAYNQRLVGDDIVLAFDENDL